MNFNLTPGRLMDYVEGRLTAEEELAVVNALRGAPPAVHGQLQWLQSFHERALTSRLDVPPPQLRDSLLQAFRRERQVFEGDLLFDSRRDVVGVRSVGLDDRWSLIHTSEVADVATDFVRDGDQVHVSGQVLTSDDRTIKLLEVRLGGHPPRDTPLDAYGQFDIGCVEPGVHELLVVFESASMTVRWDVAA